MRIRFILNPKRIAKLAKDRTLKFRVGDSDYEVKLENGVELIPIPKEMAEQLDQIVATILSDPNKQTN